METASHNVVSTLVNWWRDRSVANAELREIATLSQEDFAGVASDCGMTPCQLVSIVRAGPHAAQEMNEMLHALNIDASSLTTNDHRLFNDMQAVCANCESKGECRRHLRDGTAAQTYKDYCGNAESINALRADPDMLGD